MSSIRILSLLIILFLTILSGYCKASDPDQIKLTWVEVYNKDDIKILDRNVPETNTSVAFRERKGIFIAKCKAEVAFNLIADSKFTSKWMSGVEECRDLNQKSNTWENYTLFGLPWPFDNRELYSKFTSSVSPEGYFKIFIKSIDTLVVSKNQPLKDYYADWTIKALGNGYTEITMISASKTPPFVPLFIQDPILLMVYKDNFKRLKLLLNNARP